MKESVSFQLILWDMIKAGKIDLYNMEKHKKKVFLDIKKCHTWQCGYTMEFCENCGYHHIHYGSCNNSNCPMCGVYRRTEWAVRQQEDLVDAQYYHIIFTVPHSLNELFLADPEYMYNLLLKAQKEALQKIAADPDFLGVETIGMTTVLHTFGSNMSLHPHAHTLFVAGGLDKEGNWITPKSKKFLFPAKALAALFKGIFLDELEKHPSDLLQKKVQDFQTIVSVSRDKHWNVEIRESYSNPEHIIEYFGRYVNRQAITNSRLISYEDGKVTFEYKDYRKKGEKKLLTLEDTEFMRRFEMHILPKCFQKIRHYGFLSNTLRKHLIPIIRELIRISKGRKIETKDPSGNKSKKKLRAGAMEKLEKALGRPVRVCPKCNSRTTVVIKLPYYYKYFPADELSAAEILVM